MKHIITGSIALLLTLSVIIYKTTTKAQPESIFQDATKYAQQFTQSDSHVKITTHRPRWSTNPWLIFDPTKQNPKTKHIGFIYYPGGGIEAESYAPTTYAITKKLGYKSVLVSFPFRMASFRINTALDVAKQYPEVTHWVIAGHSHGGSMAGRFMKNMLELTTNGNSPDVIFAKRFKSIVFLDSHTVDDFSKMTWVCSLCLYGTSRDNWRRSIVTDEHKARLPKCQEFRPIIGGNHAYFGSYGDLEELRENGKLEPVEQLNLVHSEILRFFRNNKI